jgi:hypothetical protein
VRIGQSQMKNLAVAASICAESPQPLGDGFEAGADAALVEVDAGGQVDVYLSVQGGYQVGRGLLELLR